MQNFGMAIKQATNQMNKHMDLYAKHYGVTGTQMSILDFVGKHAAVLQRDIEAEFAIRRSTATLTLQRMEKYGLITRKPAEHDGRQMAVTLTPKATKLRVAVTTYIEHQQQAMEEAFTPAERAVFARMITYFIQLNGGGSHD